MSQVDRRFLDSARRKWFIYAIAREYHISPREVEEWDGDEVMEALANIALDRANRAKGKGGKPK